jgi:hypothetical protein
MLLVVLVWKISALHCILKLLLLYCWSSDCVVSILTIIYIIMAKLVVFFHIMMR